MRALLDINVLIALLDLGHVHHGRARAWFEANINHGWASCPITQNGCVRILSQPGYAQPIPIARVIGRLRDVTSTPHHVFWHDDISLLDPSLVNSERVHGSKQLTDVYLLALSVRRQGRFVTFDERVTRSAVHESRSDHLVVI